MNDTPTTRVSLILRLRDPDDAQAWEEFVAIYQPLIWSIARRLGMSRSDAGDACQEVLLRLTQVIHKWSPFVEKRNFRGWLFRVARNCMLQQFKGEPKGTFLTTRDEERQFLEALASESDAGESRFEIEFRRQVLARAIETIRPKVKPLYWQAFSLTYLENRKINDAAELLDTDAATIYVARHRVLRHLREEVERLCDSELMTFPPSDFNSDPVD